MSGRSVAGSSRTARPVPRGLQLAAPDVVTLLTAYLVVLYVIPSNRSIAALGSAGSLSVLFGVVVLVLWLYFAIIHTTPTGVTRREHPVGSPVRIAQGVLAAAVLASYVAAMTRAIPPDEVSTADSGLIRVAAWSGILFIAGDGIASMDRFTVLARRIVFAGAALATLGVVQFLTGQSFVDLLPTPGLAVGDAYSSVQVRGGLVRSAGTATHPLEYGSVLSMILPVAVVLALRDRERGGLARWTPVIVIAAGMTLAGSRSAIIGLVVGLLVVIPALTRVERAGLAVAAVGFAGLSYVLVPSVVNNLRYLFLSAGDDPSSQSRRGSLGVVADFFERSPAVGRGFGTFLPQYQILDNQYLSLLVEVGVVGLVAFVGVSATAIVCVVIAARSIPREDRMHRDLGFALAGSVVAGGVLLALFDGLSFVQAGGTLFLFLGLCAAYWRLSRDTALSDRLAALR
jgi:hypothetical protein